ncbi:hypothetical protein B0H12DRAFT_745539 [Mycena haematopus]|nr:hypothetical protein B0H12DRAFT_1329005 [Mycena haematopus]KAJ7247117.1 hypothetical protein B0H12DRAFT_745539 [Mycena haematopus]
MNDCVRILAQTLNLVHCALTLDEDDDDDPGLHLTSLDLALPCLESLTLNTLHQTPREEFLHSFIVPSLRRLELDELFLGVEPISALESFISRSGCRLQEVDIIRDFGPHYESYDSYVRAFPSISFTGMTHDDSSSAHQHEHGFE